MRPRHVAILAFAAVLLAAALALVAVWDSIPGTLRRDRQGNAHGTGRRVYPYAGGRVQLAEDYRRGRLVRSEWFRPDGSTLLVTGWLDESGLGVYLHDDGSVRVMRSYVRGRAHGPAVYFAEDGSVLSVAEYRDGIRVGGYEPRGPRL